MSTFPESSNAASHSGPLISPRPVVDACPGALQLHDAADGALARIRLPGGRMTPNQMLTLSRAAAELSNGAMELTSRGNVQLRAVSDPDQLASRLADAGLLPSITHERVRNVLASPLTGRIGGLSDVGPLIDELDFALCNSPRLSELPGRVLFSLDDGRGDVTAFDADFGIQAVAAERFAVILSGQDSGLRINADAAISTLLTCAETFLDIRSTAWRLAEVPDGAGLVIERIDADATDRDSRSELTMAPENSPPIGWLEQQDGSVALGGGLEMGRIDARLAEFLAAIDKPLIVTPWRTLLVCDLEEGAAEEVVRVLAPLGLIFDASSAWITASACTGRPGCGRALADVQADLRSAVDARMVPTDERQHWSGCERRCGRPKGSVTDVVATGQGYSVT